MDGYIAVLIEASMFAWFLLMLHTQWPEKIMIKILR